MRLGKFSVSQETPPPVPASLLVPDRFVRAVKNQSTAPSYLMATVVHNATEETKRVCLEGPHLFRAIQTENQLGWGRSSWNKVLQIILSNPTHTYKFTHPDAWQQVQPRYSPAMLVTVTEQLRSVSTVELAERFSYAKTGGIIPIDETKPPQEIFDYCAAATYVLTDRGLYVGRADCGNSLYVITPQMLAEEDALERRYAESTRRSRAEGQDFAARLPGYRSLTRRFRVESAEVGECWPGFCLSARLSAVTSQRVDSMYWLNPVHKKTRKARYDWHELLQLADHIEQLSQRFPWLHVWKTSGPNRRIEANLYGKTLHNELDDDFQKDIVYAWQDAGLRGIPHCQLELRWPEDEEMAVATLYLPPPNASEERSLLVSCSHPPHATVAGNSRHWLDRLSFHSFHHAALRQAVIVAPRGAWKMLTLPTRKR